MTVLQMYYLWNLKKTTVFTYFNINFLTMLYQTLLETSCMDPCVSGEDFVVPQVTEKTSTGGGGPPWAHSIVQKKPLK